MNRWPKYEFNELNESTELLSSFNSYFVGVVVLINSESDGTKLKLRAQRDVDIFFTPLPPWPCPT